MEYKSIWLKNVKNYKVDDKSSKKKYCSALNQDIEVDILIIGGGMTGLNTAYQLRKSNYHIALVERNKIGQGVSSRTTGKITYLQEIVYQNIAQTYSYDIANLYLQSQKKAIKELKHIIYTHQIKCHLEKNKSYVLATTKEEKDKLLTEKKLLQKMGIKIEEHNKNTISKIDKSIKYSYAISVNDTYVFNCYQYMQALKKIIKSSNISIYEDTCVTNIKKENKHYLCSVNNQYIKAKKIIIACHYPFFIKPYLFPLKANVEKSYVIAAPVKENKKYNYITTSLPTKSVRYYRDKKNYFIYVSDSHNIVNHLNNQKNITKILKELSKFHLKPQYIWTNDDIMTVDKMPYIGYLEKNNPNLIIATGYNTWGMTNSVLASLIIKDLILNKRNIYSQLFNPLRVNIFSDIDSYIANISSSCKSIIENKVIKNKIWYKENVYFENRHGKNIAIYKDEKGEHIVYSTCPHLGCTLIFNEVEHTWDCPCHASRFDIDGHCIKGPSRYDIQYHEEKNNKKDII